MQHMLMLKLRNEIFYNTCFSNSINEKSSSVLQLAVPNYNYTALNSSLHAETLSGDNSVYCNFCCSLKSASVAPAFSERFVT